MTSLRLSTAPAEEDTGNEKAGRPLATLSRTPPNPKRLQQKGEVDAMNDNHEQIIQWSQINEEMPQSYSHPLSHQGKSEVASDQVV